MYLPPDANCLLSVADHCLGSTSYVNLIVIDKQPQLQYLTAEEADAHCARGSGVWAWAGTDDGTADPDIVLACAGDVVTMETVAAAQILRERLPHFRTRVVNVVDLMSLLRGRDHPHGMDETLFRELFTDHVDVVFAFHGYPGAIHQLVHGRPDADRFRVRGFVEEGTTTTPFDMVVQPGLALPPGDGRAQQRAAHATGRQRPQGVVRGAARRPRGVRRRAPAGHARGAGLGADDRGGPHVSDGSVLVLNCGSSSVKLALVDPASGERRVTGLAERVGGPDAVAPRRGRGGDPQHARRPVVPGCRHPPHGVPTDEERDGLVGVGHRVVHGGSRFSASVAVDDATLAELHALVDLAPLHMPANLLGIETARDALPGIAQVAVFDTAFHQTMPPVAYRYAVPQEWYDEHHVRRYGFHGTSHRFVSARAAEVLGRPPEELCLVVLHRATGAARRPSVAASPSTPPWA